MGHVCKCSCCESSPLGSEATGIIRCPESLSAYVAPTYASRIKRELIKMFALPFFTTVLRKHTQAGVDGSVVPAVILVHACVAAAVRSYFIEHNSGHDGGAGR